MLNIKKGYKVELGGKQYEVHSVRHEKYDTIASVDDTGYIRSWARENANHVDSDNKEQFKIGDIAVTYSGKKSIVIGTKRYDYLQLQLKEDKPGKLAETKYVSFSLNSEVQGNCDHIWTLDTSSVNDLKIISDTPRVINKVKGVTKPMLMALVVKREPGLDRFEILERVAKLENKLYIPTSNGSYFSNERMSVIMKGILAVTGKRGNTHLYGLGVNGEMVAQEAARLMGVSV